ncbi:hypothetical protein [Rhodopseudomonas palustris]|uniref:hypothetical protein n=1 Tax=Rhodopseudomonas palustris TaxID=1076 RepID=UPI0012ECCBEB
MPPVAQVEIDVFSGRPNPRFELDDGKAARLKSLLERPRRPFSGDPPDPGLGFRGFVVELDAAESYRVVGGIVIHGTMAFVDPQRDVHDYIVANLPPEMKALLQPFLP